MLLPSSEIKKIVFAALLSLSIYGIAGQLVEWGSSKCPWDTKKTKFVAMIVIALISIFILFGHFRHVAQARTVKYTVKYGPDAASKITQARA